MNDIMESADRESFRNLKVVKYILKTSTDSHPKFL